MNNLFLRMIIIFSVFLIGTCSLLMIDNICMETTGEGGKLVFNIANLGVFQ